MVQGNTKLVTSFSTFLIQNKKYASWIDKHGVLSYLGSVKFAKKGKSIKHARKKPFFSFVLQQRYANFGNSIYIFFAKFLISIKLNMQDNIGYFLDHSNMPNI